MDVRIDRLRLQAGVMQADAARRFGETVAGRLAVALAGLPPAPGPARLPTLRVVVPGPPADSTESLAAATVAAVSRALRAEAAR